tara:strand:+ start:1360 stop:1545 length:186 start_codon:yes stop_codon:yes gene_type:complete
MSIKTIDREVQSTRGGFQSIRFKYLDTKTKRTWWGPWGDLSKKGNKEKLKIAKKNSKSKSA